MRRFPGDQEHWRRVADRIERASRSNAKELRELLTEQAVAQDGSPPHRPAGWTATAIHDQARCTEELEAEVETIEARELGAGDPEYLRIKELLFPSIADQPGLYQRNEEMHSHQPRPLIGGQ